MQEVLSGKEMPSAGEIEKKVDSLSALGVTAIEYRKSKADSLLREEVETIEKKNESKRRKS